MRVEGCGLEWRLSSRWINRVKIVRSQCSSNWQKPGALCSLSQCPRARIRRHRIGCMWQNRIEGCGQESKGRVKFCLLWVKGCCLIKEVKVEREVEGSQEGARWISSCPCSEESRPAKKRQRGYQSPSPIISCPTVYSDRKKHWGCWWSQGGSRGQRGFWLKFW